MKQASVSNNHPWTLIQVLNEATHFLKKKGIENARLNSEQLLCFVLDLSRVDLYVHFERPLNENERNGYKALLRRRGEHEPLQYILGQIEFMSLCFNLTPDVLIPRPETEILVEKVIEAVDHKLPVRILDIGVGSGNISVSLLHYLPHSEVTGLDIHQEALDLARKNADRHGVTDRMVFIQGDIRDKEIVTRIEPPYDIVVSNPPYIALSEWDTLPREIKEFEPRDTLCDEGDGLTFYRIIAEQSTRILKSRGQLFFEVGDQQSLSVRSICHDYHYQKLTILQDLNGTDRVVTGQWK